MKYLRIQATSDLFITGQLQTWEIERKWKEAKFAITSNSRHVSDFSDLSVSDEEYIPSAEDLSGDSDEGGWNRMAQLQSAAHHMQSDLSDSDVNEQTVFFIYYSCTNSLMYGLKNK